MRSHAGVPRGRKCVVLALAGVLVAGCGGGEAKGRTATALSARLDLMESENAELTKMVKQFGARITELENVILKQQNDLKKIKVAIGTAPKTLSPLVPEPESPEMSDKPILAKKAAPAPDEQSSYGWVDSAIYAEDVTGDAAAGEPTGQDEPKIVLTLYGTPQSETSTAPSASFPVVTAGPPTASQVSIMEDLGVVGGTVPLKIPVTSGALPSVKGATGLAAGVADPAVGSAYPSGTESQSVDPYAQGVLKYEAGEWSSAILYFDIHLKHVPDGPNTMNAIFLKAESLYQMGKYLEAIGQFELVLERWPGGNRAADAKLRIGRCYEKLGDKVKALSVYQDVIAGFPGTKQAKKAGNMMAGLK